MPLIVVGGQASKIGKTSVAAAILSRFRNCAWAAAKTTSHLHQPDNCQLAASANDWRIWKQILPGNDSDTARFLSAGAQIALLLQAGDSSMPMATAALQRELAGHNYVIIESNRIVDYVRPDLFLLLASASREEVKSSYARRVLQADMLLVEGGGQLPSDLQAAAHDKPTFELRLPIRECDSWMEAVADRIF